MASLADQHRRKAFTVVVGLGSSGCNAVDRYAACCQQHGKDLHDGRIVRILKIDAQANEGAASPLTVGAPGTHTGPPVTFIPAQVPDADSLERTEAKGEFWSNDRDWASKEGQAMHTAGSGNDPRYASTVFACIRAQVRKELSALMRVYLDYRRQEANITTGDPEPDGNALRLILICSLLGGTGPGMRDAVKQEVATLAEQYGVTVRLLTIVMGLGTIDPVNPPQGVRNVIDSLQYAQAAQVCSLDYVNGDGPVRQSISESTILLTNQNRFGEIPTLERFLHSIGVFLYHYVLTDIGSQLDDRIVDIEKSNAADDHGGPCRTSTFGLSILHLDAVRFRRYAGANQMHQLCVAALGEPANRQSVRQAALRDARALSILETENEPLASQQVAQLDGLSGVGLFERIPSVYDERVRGQIGFALCEAQARARRWTLEVELARNLVPALRESCRRLCQQAASAIRQTLAFPMQKVDVLRCRQAYLADSRGILEHSAERNDAAARGVADSMRAIEENLAGQEREFEQLAAMGRLGRLFHFARVNELNSAYRLQVEAELRGEAMLAVRHALAQNLFRPLLIMIGEETAATDANIARMQALRDRKAMEMAALANQPAEQVVPVGIELVGPEFLARRTAGLVSGLGGAESVTHRVFQAFLGRIGALENLAKLNLEHFTNGCDLVARPSRPWTRARCPCHECARIHPIVNCSRRC